MNSDLTLRRKGEIPTISSYTQGSGPSAVQRTARVGGGVGGDSRLEAASKAGSSQPDLHVRGRNAWGSSCSTRCGQPSLPQGRAQLRSKRPAKSGPDPASSARPSAAAPGPPPAGMGVGPCGHRPGRADSGGESEPHPLRQPRTYLQGRAGLLDSGHGPEGRSRGGRSTSQGPRVSQVAQGGERGRWAAAGRRGPSQGSRGPGSPLSTRPPSPPPPFCLRLRVAAAALRCDLPDVRISRRRLRGGRGLGASGCPAAGERARRLRPPCSGRWPAAQRVGEGRPTTLRLPRPLDPLASAAEDSPPELARRTQSLLQPIELCIRTERREPRPQELNSREAAGSGARKPRCGHQDSRSEGLNKIRFLSSELRARVFSEPAGQCRQPPPTREQSSVLGIKPRVSHMLDHKRENFIYHSINT
ncbi:putative hydro-lyase KRH_21160 [Marmota marmota marmota]|uniref:putative hydro-lyase KRH_21160 n=1 Tax=Marmota marmota marmota TaxID=9994 RepID=UPI00209287FD|nr:putative hydro-lyase KRH_21160 [Marmota marmota marmota]